MFIEPIDYVNKIVGYPVVAIQVTERNIMEVASWCGGEFWSTPTGIFFKTARTPMCRSRRVSLGHWVVRKPMDGYFRYYKPESFRRSFRRIEEEF